MLVIAAWGKMPFQCRQLIKTSGKRKGTNVTNGGRGRGSKNTHQCYGVKFAPLLRGANQHLNSVCSSKIAIWLLLPSLGWIYHLCCSLNWWCQDRWFTFGSLKGFRRNVSTIKKKSDPLAESQTFSLAPHPCILHLLTVFMLYMMVQTVTQQKQNIHCSHDMLSNGVLAKFNKRAT